MKDAVIFSHLAGSFAPKKLPRDETDADDEGTEDERHNAKKKFVPPKKQSQPKPKENAPTPKPHAPRSFVHQEVTPIQTSSQNGANSSKNVQPKVKVEPKEATKIEPTIQTKIEPKTNINGFQEAQKSSQKMVNGFQHQESTYQTNTVQSTPKNIEQVQSKPTYEESNITQRKPTRHSPPSKFSMDNFSTTSAKTENSKAQKEVKATSIINRVLTIIIILCIVGYVLGVFIASAKGLKRLP